VDRGGKLVWLYAIFDMKVPALTVLMATYNCGSELDAAIASIRAQTFSDFEFLVVDDGSGDDIADRVERIAAEDRRIRLMRLAANQGLAAALNHGLAAARGPIVVRMDADDIAAPGRLRRQYAHLAENPDTILLGTNATVIDAQGARLGRMRQPARPLALLFVSMLKNPFIHPTTAFRLGEGDGPRYDESLHSAQDYDLWTRLLALGDGANLTAPLLSYRQSPSGITGTRRREQLDNHRKISNRQTRALLGDAAPGEAELELLREVFVWPQAAKTPDAGLLGDAMRALERLADAFLSAHARSRDDVRLVQWEVTRFMLGALRRTRCLPGDFRAIAGRRLLASLVPALPGR
jgi:hypothetical protein